MSNPYVQNLFKDQARCLQAFFGVHPHAKAGEKKRVYVEVMKKATDRQNAVIRELAEASK